MQDPFPIPSCFFSSSSGARGDKYSDDDPTTPTSASSSSSSSSKTRQSVVMSVYRTKIAGHCRLITITWCRNLLVHGLSISIEASSNGHNAATTITTTNNNNNQYICKVELRPWYFWRKQGNRRFHVEETPVDVFWDLRSARFSSGEPEPVSDYYVAVVAGGEVVLLLGDQKKEAFRRSNARPSIIDAIVVSKKEHVFGKKKFTTRAKFHERGKFHEISIECLSGGGGGGSDPEMVVKVDGHVAVHVRHLQWKFRGNECISVNKVRVEVYWDVHDWLFGPGLRHALFIFKPTVSPAPPGSGEVGGGRDGGDDSGGGQSDFCLFLYAWKLE